MFKFCAPQTMRISSSAWLSNFVYMWLTTPEQFTLFIRRLIEGALDETRLYNYGQLFEPLDLYKYQIIKRIGFQSSYSNAKNKLKQPFPFIFVDSLCLISLNRVSKHNGHGYLIDNSLILTIVWNLLFLFSKIRRISEF